MPVYDSSEPLANARDELPDPAFSLIQSSMVKRLALVGFVLVVLWIAAFWALQ